MGNVAPSPPGTVTVELRERHFTRVASKDPAISVCMVGYPGTKVEHLTAEEVAEAAIQEAKLQGRLSGASDTLIRHIKAQLTAKIEATWAKSESFGDSILHRLGVARRGEVPQELLGERTYDLTYGPSPTGHNKLRAMAPAANATNSVKVGG